MIRDMRLYIQDMLESIEAIEEYVHLKTEEQFYSNVQKARHKCFDSRAN